MFSQFFFQNNGSCVIQFLIFCNSDSSGDFMHSPGNAPPFSYLTLSMLKAKPECNCETVLTNPNREIQQIYDWYDNLVHTHLTHIQHLLQVVNGLLRSLWFLISRWQSLTKLFSLHTLFTDDSNSGRLNGFRHTYRKQYRSHQVYFCVAKFNIEMAAVKYVEHQFHV